MQFAIEKLTDWGMRSDTAWLAQLSESLNRTNYYALFFVMGAVLAKHLPAIRTFVREHRRFRILSACAIPFLIPSQWILAALGLSFRVRHALLLTGVGIILFLLLCMESPRLTGLLSNSKPLLLLGKLSFSLVPDAHDVDRPLCDVTRPDHPAGNRAVAVAAVRFACGLLDGRSMSKHGASIC